MSRKPIVIVLAVLVMAAIACQTASQPGSSPPAAQPSAEPISGEQTFNELGCTHCHDGDASTLAPSLYGLYGEEVYLDSGETVLADENYLRESILTPSVKIVSGYQSIMPDFQSRIDDVQLQALVEFIQSLAD